MELSTLLREDLAGVSMLAYFNRKAHTDVIANASPVGLDAVLVQEVNGESREVCYAIEVLVTLSADIVQQRKKL